LAARSALCSRGRRPGQAFDHRAHVVHVLHLLGLQRSDHQTAARRVAQHALGAQQQQRLLHRLARNAQRLGDLLLDDALALRELAGAISPRIASCTCSTRLGVSAMAFHAAQFRQSNAAR
jgi:hypothetical protein